MSFRALDGEGDWTFGQGRSNYATGQAAIAFDVQTRQMMFRNDCFAALLFGIQWFLWLSSKNPAAANGILLETRQMLIGTVGGYPSFGVEAINSVNLFQDPRTREFELTYDVATIYSLSFQGSVKIPAIP